MSFAMPPLVASIARDATAQAVVQMVRSRPGLQRKLDIALRTILVCDENGWGLFSRKRGHGLLMQSIGHLVVVGLVIMAVSALDKRVAPLTE